MKEREENIIGKKEVKKKYYSESKEIAYFVIEEVEDKSIVKLIEKKVVNMLTTINYKGDTKPQRINNNLENYVFFYNF